MRFIKYLLEDYFGLVGPGALNKEAVPIFINPNKKELFELSRGSGYIRYIADFDHKVLYAWRAESATHQTIMRWFNFYDKFKKSVRSGGDWTGYKIEPDNLYDYIEIDRLSEKEIRSAKWFEKYVDLDLIIKTFENYHGRKL